jgi:hypothetical protein
VNENRVKVIVEADSAGAITSFGDFLKVLDRTGASVKLSDDALAKLADRFRDKLSADQAAAALDRTRAQIERLGTAAGLSQQELGKLMRQLGVAPAQITATSKSLSDISGGVTAAAGSFGPLIAQLTAAVAAYVSLKSVIGLVSDSLTAAARYQTMGVVLEQVGQNAGYSREQMLGFAAGVQQAGISMIEARESVAKMAAAQLDLTKSAELARVAQDAAVIANTNSSDAFAKIVQGITTGQTVLLHHMGIMVSLEDAYQQYAKSLGITKGELTESQKRTAALNAVLEEGAKRAGTYEAAMGTVGKQLQSFKRYVQDFETMLGTAFLDAASSNVSAATDSMRELQSVIQDPATQDVLASLAGGLSNVLNILITETPSAVGAIVAGIKDIQATWQAVPEEVKTLLKYGTAAALGARVGGVGGAVLATGITALDNSDSFRNWRISSMESNAAKMNDALYNEADPAKRKELEENLNAQLDLLQSYRDKRLSISKQFAEESKRYSNSQNDESAIPGLPSKSERDAANRYWAEYNAGLRQYKDNVAAAAAIGEKNKSHAPIDQQQTELAKNLKSQQETIAKGWSAAWAAGDWDTVRKLNDAANASLGAYNDGLDKLDRKANRGAKSAAAAAVAAERYGEQASAYLDNVTQSLQSMQDTLSGGMNKEADRVDKWFVQAINQAEKAMIGAKGDTAAYVEALQKLRDAWPRMKDLAVQKDIIATLKQQAQILQDIAQATGDPAMKYEADKKAADAWYAEKRQLIESSYQDEAQKTAMLAALQDGYNAKLLEAKTAAYKDLSGVSDQYWEAERARIEQHLATVKQHATDETAYKIYEAQQWDAYNKALLEKQEQYAGTFAETLAAKWALAYGTYKSEATRAKETWEQTSQSIIDATNSVIDGVAGGVGDMVRSFADGTGSIESLIQNMRSRILDMFASMIEELIRKWLTDFVGRLGSGDGISLGSLFGSSSSSGGGVSLSSLTGSGGSSGSGLDLSSFTSLGKWIGKETGSSLVDSLSSSSSGLSMVIGDAPDIGASIGKELASYGDVWNAGSDMWTAGESFAKWSSGSFTSAASTAGSLSSMLSSTLGIVGAIGGVVGLVSSLFSSSEKTEKTGSGYKIAINAGTLNMSGVDFYKTTKTSGFGGTSTSYSTVSTGMVDPDVAKQVNDTLKETAEQLHDFAKTLGFSVDILDSFSMPEMTITDGQLQSYMRNTSNAMAFSALDEAGLRGAFDFVADKYEVYVDEFKRLADAYKLVGGYTEAYGYDLETLAGITADQIAEIRQVNTETAQGTAQALLSMASSMGATEAQLAELAATASDGSQALAVTDEQLSKILQADYASDLIDAVGGEDAFSTLMTNLVKNTLDSVQAYEENATYYAGKAGEAIEELGRSGVTIANFWDAFDQAMHGALSVEEFERWADAAGWVNALNVVTDALEDWADTVAKAYQSLDVRAMQAQGLDYQAELAELLASAEWELVAAREAGYDAAYLSRLAEVQALEYAAKIAEHAEDYAGELREAQKRYATAIDDSGTLVTLAIAENQAELQKLAKEYNWSPGSAEEELFQTLQRAQWAEIINMIQETADATAEATRAMRADLEARRATIAGYDEEAQALQMVAGFADELAQAYADGIDPDLITDLMSVQMDELAQYWADTIDKMSDDLRDLYQTQSELLNSLTGNTQSAIEELYGLFERYQAGETDLADSIIDSLKAIANAVNDMVEDIYSTIYEIRTGEDYRTDTADVAAANAKSYFEEQYAKAAAGDTEAMSNITSYATSYLSALKSSTADESVYRSGVDWITSMLSQLATSGTGIGGELTGIGKTVTDDQIEEARKALHRAEVAQAKSKADALFTQSQEAFKGSDVAKYISGLATTGIGWQGLTDLFADYEGDGRTRLQELQSGQLNWTDYIGWFLNHYGVGTGYVDWSGAMGLYRQYAGALPGGSETLYQSYIAAQDAYLALKSQYGFALGGVISSPSTAGDNTLVFANGGERVLTPRQNDAFEELVFGGGQGGGRLVEALIARVDRLTDAVDAAKKANTEENRAMTRRLTSIASQVDDWALNGSLQVGVKGPVEVTGTVEVAP